ncbi:MULTISPECIES: FAD-dependent oxidoreductase [unclassified Beijerinckia]|uniref:NAD(P)/FAD-dependent oxidoreductase n=1 Tax=unclassified Beijerinckia TaxID=2638183 RepID=UPI0008951330|nr:MULTISPECIES: FAD-dependent oxidoreductase [unclassified Beijerinckia]MDH7797057.1 3-phenylpropionate/trans-cinnamate dioxygenase ferredoxin reductase subunit [Beijerinckia sp. GAS462]SEC70515.1 3-phenylpropionate/trans-cinnamate dioxygenase ferredoxin reductase subunit [Beijerinckia sp. 28-YEA-48]
MSGVVIVGGGHGGVDLAFGLRERGYTGPIAVLDKSDFLPYERPPMSKTWINGTGGPEDLALRGADAFSGANIDLMLGCEVLGIDRAQKIVETNTGSIQYATLILALGSNPRQLKLSDNPLIGMHQLHTLEQAIALRDDLTSATKIGVIGAGFIGLELASSAAKRGIPVTVMETAGRLMPRTASEFTSTYMRSRHEEAGTNFRFNAAVREVIGESGRVRRVDLSDGSHVEADLVVQGVGALANGGWVADAGLDFDNGIIVDKKLRTQDPNIFAIGDCARFQDDEGGAIRLESIGNAADHARRVAATIAGVSAPVPDVPWFWTQQAGVRLQMAGRIDRVENWLLTGSVESNTFSVLGWRNSKLVYGESINSPSDHVAIRKLLADNTALSLSKLQPIAEMGLKAAIKSLV